MKTMTCMQMGGPCDEQLHAETAEEMMHKGGEHVNAKAAEGDEAHKQVKQGMDAMMAHPDSEENQKWTEDFKNKFNATPDDAESSEDMV